MSSSDIAVSVRGLSKSYSIAHNAAKHSTLGEALMHRFRRPMERAEKETFWALKDVSFDIKKGDVVGIIGRNGAGKSTLLKILSRITEPTTGQIDLYGRVGSLLEVGTGFHPELTGRENIYLNGAILGMKRSEITRQFDAIVDFSGTEKFLDTPVKRYSSGMYVRLAFAVAAHLNPEILIVDEVLAVGDSDFQKKCLGKMKDVASGGRTVLFVSHNIASISQLCNSAILLEEGKLVMHDGVDSVIATYMNFKVSSSKEAVVGKRGVLLLSGKIIDAHCKEEVSFLHFNNDYIMSLSVRSTISPIRGAFYIKIYNETGSLVSSICSMEEGMDWFEFCNDTKVEFDIPKIQLMPGSYSVSVSVTDGQEDLLIADNYIAFSVEPYIVNDAIWAYQKFHGIVRISQGIKSTQIETPKIFNAIES